MRGEAATGDDGLAVPARRMDDELLERP